MTLVVVASKGPGSVALHCTLWCPGIAWSRRRPGLGPIAGILAVLWCY